MNKFKKVLATGLALSLGLAFFAGCQKTDSDNSGAQGGNKVIRIAAQTYPLYSPINLAYELGYVEEELKNAGYTLEWTDYASGPLVNEAVAAGEADIGYMADLPAIIARSSGQDIQVVSGVSSGERSLAVLVKADSDIKDIKDLAGKKIAYASGSYAQHLLALVLDQAGLTFNDVESINLGAADSPAALEAGEVDAIVIWEQFITKLTTEGVAKVLIDGTGIKKSNMVVYSVKSFAEANPEAIQAFIKAINRGSEYISSNPDDAAARLAKTYNVTPEQMAIILGNFNFSVKLAQDDIDEILKVANYAHEAGIITNPVDESFITTKYITGAGF